MRSLNPKEYPMLYAMLDLPGYMFYKDTASKYVWCNHNFAHLAGIDCHSDMVGKTDFDLPWGSELADQFMVDDQRVLRKGIYLSKEYKVLSKEHESEIIYIRIDRAPLYDNSHQICGVIANGLDITVQKNQEREENKAHRFLKDIFYNLPGLIYWKNLKSQYMGFNKNVVQLSGLSRKQLLGKTDLELNWGQREAESFQRDDQEVINTGIAKITEHEIPIKREDGHFVVVKTVKSPLYDEKGKVVGVLAIAIDITEQKILEQKLITENEKVEQLSRSKTEFIRNMEHDIRTPFTGIYTLSKILEEQETKEDNKILISAISQSAKELLDYCNVILDFSRIESGAMPILAKKFDMKVLLNGVVAIERPAIEGKGLKITVHYPTDTHLNFIGDEYRIQRILVNLISNAIKFTQKGEIKVTLELAKIVNNRECVVRLSVEDTGIGMPKEKLFLIYEKFNRLTPSNQGKYKGVGLGLSIVKHLIEDIDAEIDVNSIPGRGTTFICTVPLKFPLVDDQTFEGERDNG